MLSGSAPPLRCLYCTPTAFAKTRINYKSVRALIISDRAALCAALPTLDDSRTRRVSYLTKETGSHERYDHLDIRVPVNR